MKRYIAVFLAGLVCMGIGATVAATEFLSLELVERPANFSTKEQTVLYKEGAQELGVELTYYADRVRVEADSTLAANEVRISLRYDSKQFSDAEIFTDYARDRTVVRIFMNERYLYDLLKTALSEIRERRLLTDFSHGEQVSVTVYVHPSMQQNVMFY